MKLLLIEDNIELKGILKEQFQEIGVVVHDFTSVEDYFKVNSKSNITQYDAALIDYNLPGVDGVDFLKNFKCANDIPTMFIITGEAYLETDFNELPDVYIFQKPLNIEMLKSSVLASRKDKTVF